MMSRYGDQLRAKVWRSGVCEGMETGYGDQVWRQVCSIGLETSGLHTMEYSAGAIYVLNIMSTILMNVYVFEGQ